MKTEVPIKTREEARKWLVDHGVSVSEWARKHGFKDGQVRDVLRKSIPCNHGASHRIAVLLRIKDGFIDEP